MAKVTFLVPVNEKARPLITEEIEGSVEYPIHDNLDDNVAQFTPEVVNSYFMQGARVAIQNAMRPALLQKDEEGSITPSGISPDSLQAKADEYKLGVKTPSIRKSKKELAFDAVDELTEDDLLEMAKRVKARREALKQQ